MKIIFDGAHVRYEGANGEQPGKFRASLTKKRVAWSAVVMLKDGAGNAMEARWNTPKNHRMNYLEAKAAVFTAYKDLCQKFIEAYALGPDSVHFTLVSR